MLTSMRKMVVSLVAAFALAGGLVVAATATADAAPVAVKKQVAKPKLVKYRTAVKMRVATRAGAVLYSTRTGKVVRDKRDRARRIRYSSVRAITHRSMWKKRHYSRIAGTRYMVRTSALRVVPKAKPKPRPVVKPAPKPPVVKPTPTPSPTPTPTPTPQPPSMPTVTRGPHNAQATTLVFGDSISMNADSWWATVGDLAGTNMRVDAIGGTGLISGGYLNLPFASRLGWIGDTKPQSIVVEGGRNDWTFGYGGPLTTDADKETGFRDYFEQLAAEAEEHGVPDERVYVMTPWGEADPTNRDAIVPRVKAAAVAEGFTFIDLPTIPGRLTPDGAHPDAEGSRWLAAQFIERSDWDERLAAWSPPVDVPKP